MEITHRPLKITEQLIGEVDQRVVSPGERANHIWQLLKGEHPDLTDWDVICFAAEFLGMMHTRYPWLEYPAKHVIGLVYTAHYLNAETIDAESSIRRESIPQQKESQRPTEPPFNGVRIIKTGEYDGGGG